MTVFDCTNFLNENEVYEIRINEHWDFVDKFVVIETGETHTGLKKELNFDHKRFEKYKEKLIYVSFDSFDEEMKKHPELDCKLGQQQHTGRSSLDFRRANFQYNYMVKVLADYGAKETDVVIFSCLDEIVKKEAVVEAEQIFKNSTSLYNGYHFINNTVSFTNLRPCLLFNLSFYVFKFNILRYRSEDNYVAGGITEFGNFKKVLPGTLRSMAITTHPIIKNAGWHFSYMDDTDGARVYNKYRSWAHARESIIGPDHNTLTKEESLKNLFWQYKISIPQSIVPIVKETHPKYLVDNQEKFKQFILTVE